MRTLTFTAAKGGINRQRVRGGAKAENFYDLVNGYVTGSGTVVNRDGTVRDTILPSTTRGLTAFENLLHTFSSQLELYTPVGYLANVLAHPTDPDATLVEIHFAEPFMGALYVVAEWSDGGVYHYWLASSGEWEADTVYFEGDVVTPTVLNGLLYKAVPNNPLAPTQVWRAQTNYVVGDKVLPTTYNGFYYEVTDTEGDVPTSGSSEPAWVASEGAITVESTDGTGAPSSSTPDVGTPQPPPTVVDRYGGSTQLSAEQAAAVAASDTIPLWTPGTLYQPGDLVKPRSVSPVVNSEIPNADFELGDVSWTKGTGWTITNLNLGTNGNKPYQGAWYAKWSRAVGGNNTFRYLSMSATVPVVAGQSLTAACFSSRSTGGGGALGSTTEQIVLLWYDAYDVLVKETLGTINGVTGTIDYRAFTVSDITPGGATKVRAAFKCKAPNTTIPSTIAVDSFSWDYVNLAPVPADFTVYQAVQAAAGSSGTSEPVWPGAGNTVVDNEVTWLGGVVSVIEWTAVPIMKSGATEPEWTEQAGTSVADNTVSWLATTGFVEEAPNSKIVSIAVKKIFAGDTDIEKYSATVNPLDWTTAEDAGYLPTGLNSHGANPIAATALYRGNLAVFNSAGLQVWQVDEDPELMDLLDAVPVGSTYHKALQPVKNDLIFLTPLGYRNLAIAGASTNLQAGDFGDPIDPLVTAKIKAGLYAPNSIFYPARGQYWGWFGAEVFVATLNDEGRSWSRYVFPEAITDATLLGNDLYLRTETHKVWKVDSSAVLDDQTPGQAGVVEFTTADIPFGSGSIRAGAGNLPGYAAGTFVSSIGDFVMQVSTRGETGGELLLHLLVADADVIPGPQTAYFTSLTVTGETSPGKTSSNGTFTTDGASFPGYQLYRWIWSDFALDGLFYNSGSYGYEATLAFTGGILGASFGEATGTPFEGTLWWPALDLGNLGVEKTTESFDLVCQGEVSVQFGYNQRNPDDLTEAYELDGDTLPGTSIPIEITAPSFAPKLTFAANQNWEWMALNLNVQDARSSGFAG